jgi:uncharacterized protein (TIGR02145 family)
LQGKTRDDAYRVKLYVIYTEGGKDYKLELTLSFQDCTCCEAATTYGGWLTFMCHNLGADESLDPFTYSTGIFGDLYQWGRETDGHQLRNSPLYIATTAGQLAPGPKVDGSMRTQFIVNKVPGDKYGDWRQGADGAGRWGDSTEEPAFAPKGPNDPCPEGWQVPTTWQWSSIFRGNYYDAVGAAPNESTVNTWEWIPAYSNSPYNEGGFLIGSSLYLPAAGIRRYNSGVIEYVNIPQPQGFYWSSSITSARVSRYMHFTEFNIAPIGVANRAEGMSVRCVSQ